MNSETVLYLHGFRSSPDSAKCRHLRTAFRSDPIRFIAPDLNVPPNEAIGLAESLVSDIPDEKLTIIGSSLGGFYAAWLASRRQCRSVLLNPALSPWLVVKDYVGEQTVYGTNRKITVSVDYGEQLRRFVPQVPPAIEKTLLILSTGDEVLDWREAAHRYARCRQILSEGDNHGIERFTQYCPVIRSFVLEHVV